MSLPALPVPVSAQGLHRQQSQSVPGPQGETCAGKMNSVLRCEDKWGQNCYFVRIAPMSTYVLCPHFVDEYGRIGANLEMSVTSEISAIPW